MNDILITDGSNAYLNTLIDNAAINLRSHPDFMLAMKCIRALKQDVLLILTMQQNQKHYDDFVANARKTLPFLNEQELANHVWMHYKSPTPILPNDVTFDWFLNSF